jgi:hypothetical protein
MVFGVALLALGAVDDLPHYHRGKLTQYEIGPPSVLLSNSDEQRLKTGKPVLQAVETGVVGARRMLMVQDIAAPANVVMECVCHPVAKPRAREQRAAPERCTADRLCPNPPQPNHGPVALRQDGGRGMQKRRVLSGEGAICRRLGGPGHGEQTDPARHACRCSALIRPACLPPYLQEGATQKVKTTYDIAVMHMKFRYYMEHEYDPDQKCMVFHLDYSRRSDIDDSVGYWYVQPSGRASSRVYYSCECKLRGWVPGPVYNVLTKEALNKVRIANARGNPLAAALPLAVRAPPLHRTPHPPRSPAHPNPAPAPARRQRGCPGSR